MAVAVAGGKKRVDAKIARHTGGNRFALKEQAGFEPVQLGDLIEQGLRISVHCRQCGHFTYLDAALVPMPRSMSVPAHEGRFRCGICGSRNSCAMPEYRRPKPG